MDEVMLAAVPLTFQPARVPTRELRRAHSNAVGHQFGVSPANAGIAGVYPDPAMLGATGLASGQLQHTKPKGQG